MNKKLVSFILTLAMVLSMVPMFGTVAFATGGSQAGEPLCFTAEGDSTKIELVYCSTDTKPTADIVYSIDEKQTWNSYQWDSKWDSSMKRYRGDEIDLSSKDSKVYFKASGQAINMPFSINSFGYYNFTVPSGNVSVSGDVTTLLKENGVSDLSAEYENKSWKECFRSLFKDCTALTTAPALPATTLAENCYQEMFSGCTGLTAAPELPATTLAAYCYYSMFSGCTGLTAAPELPATTLAAYCYYSMFSGCKNLTTSPVLPATIMAESCYSSMFSDCINLTTSPVLPAMALAKNCYNGMFKNCEALTTAPELSATTLAAYCYSEMFMGCTKLATAPVLRAKELATNCCKSMFKDCTTLTTAPELPATTLAAYCYLEMFCSCSALKNVPVLPSEILTEQCYDKMFKNCISLETAPEIKANTLATKCCFWMFDGCTLLTAAPDLPATTLAEECYNAMFQNCSSLVEAPDLPATTLVESCYNAMFKGCTFLVEAPDLPATTLADKCYQYMFQDCSSLVEAPDLPATTLASNCYQGMFSGCTSLAAVSDLPATQLEQACYQGMFYNCTSLTTAPVLSAKTLVKNCYSSMFNGCSSLEYLAVGFDSWGKDDALKSNTSSWLSGVPVSLTFVGPVPSSTSASTVLDKEKVVAPYKVVINENIEHGTIKADKSRAQKDETITLTVTPAAGYKLMSLVVSDSSIEIASTSATNYVFTMPAVNVTVSAIFEAVEIPAPPAPVYYGGDVTYYDVLTSAGANGTIDVDKKSASSGTTVTVTVTPKKGFALETLTILDKNGKEIEVKDTKEKNKYTFRMSSSKVTVNATFMEDNTMLNYCVDVKKEDYFYDSVLWSYENEICKGTDELHFSPKKTLTRAEAVTFLWRIAGEPVVNYWMQFKDVESGRYYTEAVRWAASEKIAVGYSDEKFGTTDLITREQLATMIYGYVQKKGEGFIGSWMFLLPYEDRSKISDWANEAAHWCSMKGVINGKDGNLFDPQGTATRAEAITMLYRFDSLMK